MLGQAPDAAGALAVELLHRSTHHGHLGVLLQKLELPLNALGERLVVGVELRHELAVDRLQCRLQRGASTAVFGTAHHARPILLDDPLDPIRHRPIKHDHDLVRGAGLLSEGL